MFDVALNEIRKENENQGVEIGALFPFTKTDSAVIFRTASRAESFTPANLPASARWNRPSEMRPKWQLKSIL